MQGDKQTNDYDIINIYSDKIECVVSETHAVYYTLDNCEFIIISLDSFTRTHQV